VPQVQVPECPARPGLAVVTGEHLDGVGRVEVAAQGESWPGVDVVVITDASCTTLTSNTMYMRPGDVK